MLQLPLSLLCETKAAIARQRPTISPEAAAFRSPPVPLPSFSSPYRAARSRPAIPPSARFTSMHPTSSSPTSTDGSRRRAGRTRRPSRTHRRACSLRRCRPSRSYWGSDYDWRKAEAELDSLPQFVTTIDGVDIHFIHVRSKEKNALPRHHHARLARLGHRADQDHRSADQSDGARRERFRRVRRRDSVAAGLRPFGQADRDRLGSHPHRARVDRAHEAPRIHAIPGAGRRLGECRHGADGSAGASGADRYPHQHAGHRAGRHRQGGVWRRAGAVGPLGRREARLRSARLSSTSTAWATPARWRTARRRSTPWRTRRSAWPPGCWTTTRAARSSSPASSTASPRG